MDKDRRLVLTIDDSGEMRSLIRHSLRRLDVEVSEAIDGETALLAIANELPDLILLDVCMPGKDGLAICAELRSIPECQDVPIVIVSSAGEDDIISRAYDAGATDFLLKPFDPNAVAHRVRYLLRAGNAFTDLRRSQRRLEHAQRIAKLGYWEWNVVLDWVSCSDEAYRIFGGQPGMALTSASVLQTVHRDDIATLNGCIEETIRNGKPYAIEHRIVRGGGEERIVEHHGQAIFDGNHYAKRVIGTVRDITEQRHAEAKIHQLAYYDVLTGLPNRFMLREHLTVVLPELLPADRTAVLMSIDLDRFKRVNDSFGHDFGDELLCEVTRRLQAAVRTEGLTKHHTVRRDRDFVARVGEDGFSVMMLVDKFDLLSVERVATRILESIRQPIELHGQAIYCTASMGIALSGQDGGDVDTLLKNVDAAMFHAKSVARNGFQFYSASMTSASTKQLMLESDLRQALDSQQFHLLYQPKFDLARDCMVGMEALIRCRDSKHGTIGADQIVACAEETGLIHEVGEFVLRTALAQLKLWQQTGHPDLKVSVNLSPLQFRNMALVRSVEDALASSGIRPECLELEITESAVMHDVEHTIATLRALKLLGVSLSIDDFGVGYSSLGYLARFPVDCLKIDRSFVSDLPDNKHEAIVTRGIISMARGLNLITIAEGVETQTQLEFLRNNGCEQVQGYLLSPPISAEEIAVQFLRAPKRSVTH